MTPTTPTPALADLDLRNAIKLAGMWANAEFAHASNLGAGGPGQIEKVEKAEAAARAAIEALARRAAQPVAPVQDVLTIPKAIMEMPCDVTLSHFPTRHEMAAYKQGHRDARHAAADLVLARADELKALAPSPQIAEKVELPPLPTPSWARDMHGETEVYTADEVRQIQRDAIAASRRVLVERAAAPAPTADLSARLEEIAESWDGCEYDAPGEMMDIGASLRSAFAKLSLLATQPAAAPQDEQEAIGTISRNRTGADESLIFTALYDFYVTDGMKVYAPTIGHYKKKG